jgi:hypothetical protein
LSGSVELVDRIKRTLESRGVDLRGADGAFQITKRVAWELRGEGAGLLSKPGGNNSAGFAVDVIAYPNGHIFDILVGSGDVNGPAWQDAGEVDASRYRAPFDPGDDVPPVQPPIVEPPPPPAPDPQLLERLTASLANVAIAVELLTTRLEEIQKTGVHVKWG